MAFSMHTTGSEVWSAAARWRKFRRSLARVASITGSKLGSLLKTVQTARMMTILANMSDQQLDEIGITRSDIPRYAEELMSDG